MRNKNKLIFGVGINDLNESMSVNGKDIKVYTVWYDMILRCYSSKSHIKHPTYKDCIVCEEWLLLSNFKKWFDINYIDGLHLDKDILVQGNKVYSPNTCCFVPSYINSLLVYRGRFRGEYPLGISLVMTKGQLTPTYGAFCSNGRGKRLNKTFKTIEEAQAWYSETKHRVVREQAQRAISEHLIDWRVYIALVRRNWLTQP